MRKYIWGLGTAALIETDCEELEEYLSNFYYLSEEPCYYDLHNRCSISTYGKDYLIEINDEKIPVSHKRILPYLNYCIIDRFCMTEQKCSIYLHSSGFVYEDKVFLFFNSSGAGKTTLVAYCLLHNEKTIGFLGDDVIRIDLHEHKVYGLACGMRVKQGTKTLYFNNIKMYEFTDEGEPVWIFRPQNALVESVSFTDAKQVYFINIKYVPQAKQRIDLVSGMDKIQMIMKNTYSIQDNKKNIFNNIPALSKFSFYYVEYSNTKELMNCLLNGIVADDGR